jgi:membrane protease YdiL (CAAX protease family)
VNPFFEELIARAFVMTELKALTRNTAIAIAGSVLLQTSYHFYQGAPAAISHGATFLVFSLYYAKTNRIGAPILAHLLLDLLATVNYMAKLGQYHF